MLGSHRMTASMLAKNGVILNPLPFHGAIWVKGTGENHSGESGANGSVPVDDAMRNEFAFPAGFFDFNFAQ